VADQSPLPILLHSMPSLLDLPPELIIDLADHPNIVGMKECSPSVSSCLNVTIGLGLHFMKFLILILR